ncbi:MAG: FGGY-family carbohydrate kinase [Clostridiales bacterium]|nr:FGGY-family carbohydrate kinase [Clostridiales bacterium]
MEKIRNAIREGDTYLGIELGSTRIKAVLIDKEHTPIAKGSHNWKNKLENGIWTYSLDDIWTGLRDCYAQLAKDVHDKYDVELETIGGMGISAMMHGYMVFDKKDNLLVPFRTWRNTITSEASNKLTELFGFNIPQRWSIAHLYQAILNNEDHIAKISHITTLAGYIHWQLTGNKVLGIGDASSVFPIDDKTHQYNSSMLSKFTNLIGDNKFPWKIEEILPKILTAGEMAGVISDKGTKLLDPTGRLNANIAMCPPEGDAGTGMVATNAVKKRTGNISAGTSIFAMVVLEKPLSKVSPEIDIITTPSGDAVAMVHCNNCLGDIDAWVKLLGDAASLLGAEFDINTLYSKLYNNAFEGDADCGELLSYNYISGEHITGFQEGRPLFMRTPHSNFNLANFIRANLYSACASLKIGMRILVEQEGAALDSITGHGGFFKQKYVGQRIMSAVIDAPVTVMSTAGEGGPWGMAILAAYMQNNRGEKLVDYLMNKVFVEAECTTINPNAKDVEGFKKYMQRYQTNLKVERVATETFKTKEK